MHSGEHKLTTTDPFPIPDARHADQYHHANVKVTQCHREPAGSADMPAISSGDRLGSYASSDARMVTSIGMKPGDDYSSNTIPAPSEPHLSAATGRGAVSSFLADMPTRTEDPAKHAMWTELIRLKTRTLEFEIAEARQKEKEAELELAKLKAEVQLRSNEAGSIGLADLDILSAASQQAGPSTSTEIDPTNSLNPFSVDTRGMSSIGVPSSNDHMSVPLPGTTTSPFGVTQMPLAPFDLDLEAMLQDKDLDSLFAWLPDLGNPTHNIPAGTTAIDPSNLLTTAPVGGGPYDGLNELYHQGPYRREPTPPTESPLRKRRSPSLASSSSTNPPPAKKAKRGPEKKVVVEHASACIYCKKPIGRVLVRALKSQMPRSTTVAFKCLACVPVEQPSNASDSAALASTIGTVDMRKRVRMAIEADDEEVVEEARRVFCDVCQRIVASGQVIGGNEKEKMGHMAEIVCSSCDSKYQR